VADPGDALAAADVLLARIASLHNPQDWDLAAAESLRSRKELLRAHAPARPPGQPASRVPLSATERRQPVRCTVSFSTSISGTAAHRRAISFLTRRRFRGSGAASSEVSRIAPVGRSAISTQSRSGSAPSSSASADHVSRHRRVPLHRMHVTAARSAVSRASFAGSPRGPRFPHADHTGPSGGCQ
jgi:hypothetical protein